MAKKQGQNRNQPEIKVIPNEEKDEVVRLEAPGEGQAPKKVGSLRREDRLPTATKEEMTVVSDLEEGIESSDPETAFRVPPAIVALVILGFLGLLSLGIFLAMGGRDGKTSDKLETTITENKQEQEDELTEARSLLATIQGALTGYASASTIDERLRHSRHPERVRPLMESYYRDHEFEALSEVQLEEQLAVPLGNRSFVVLTANSKEQDQKVYLAEVTNDLEVKIDWESDICYQPVPIDQLSTLRPTEPFALRVNAIPDNHYVYEFADPDRYQCLKLTFRDYEDHFFAYIEKGTAESQELFNYFRRTAVNGAINPAPMLLRVRFLPDGKGDNLLAIDDFLAPRWAFLDNPAKSEDN